MRRDSSMTELNGFLAKHEPVAKPRLYDIGSVLGEWKVTAFLGSGGNAEAYRVVRDADGQVAAAKVLLRDDDASKTRFRQEAALLSARMGTNFAKFYSSGETGGRLYIVSELLEPVDLPESDVEIADYLLTICKAVGELHRAGLIHRDIKPSNIMRRASGELVLIDLGLVKDVVKSCEPEKGVSIVSDKPVAVGTPRYAAPEQMVGGRVTAATDVHAIGRLADVAFGSAPPRSWLPIIRRATSSIPDRRYATVEALAHAIRHRNDRRHALLAAVALGLSCIFVGSILVLWRTMVEPKIAWQALCENVTTNLVAKELLWERLVTNKVGNATMVFPERAYKNVQRQAVVTMLQLKKKYTYISRPVLLDAAREYFIEGPGILSADIRSKGGGDVKLHLKNCFVFNRSPVPIDKAGIHYAFEGGVYLNFTCQDKVSGPVVDAHIDGFDGACDEIRFRGPMTRQGLERVKEEERRMIMNWDNETFSKNLYLPRHIFALKWKYVVEDMEDSIYEKYGIDPDRVPTAAEIELVAYCFGVSDAEAASILFSRANPFFSGVSPLDGRKDPKTKVKG